MHTTASYPRWWWWRWSIWLYHQLVRFCCGFTFVHVISHAYYYYMYISQILHNITSSNSHFLLNKTKRTCTYTSHLLVACFFRYLVNCLCTHTKKLRIAKSKSERDCKLYLIRFFVLTMFIFFARQQSTRVQPKRRCWRC